MDKFLKFFKIVFSIIGAIAAFVSIYVVFHKDVPKLEVQTISERLLTDATPIDGLEVRYVYDSIEVHNLWQMQYAVKNIGELTIVGQGAEKMIIDEGVLCNFSPKNANIISLKITNNNFGAELDNELLSFKQWRKDEYIEIEAMVESDVKPELRISDRDIIDANIVYTKYNPANNSQHKDRLYDKLPSVLFKTLRIIYSIIVGLTIIASILAYKTTTMDKNAKIVGVWMIIIMVLGALAFY